MFLRSNFFPQRFPMIIITSKSQKRESLSSKWRKVRIQFVSGRYGSFLSNLGFDWHSPYSKSHVYLYGNIPSLFLLYLIRVILSYRNLSFIHVSMNTARLILIYFNCMITYLGFCRIFSFLFFILSLLGCHNTLIEKFTSYFR